MRSSLVVVVTLLLATASCAEAEPPPSLGGDGGALDAATGGDADATAPLDQGVLDSAPADAPVEDVADVAVDTGVDTASDDGGADTEPPLDGSAGCHPVVNEIQVAGTTMPGDEFVELYNPCASDVSLAGWRLVYRSAAGTTDVTMMDLATYSLPAGGYLLFAGEDCSVCGAADGTYPGATGTLGGAGGGVALKNGTAVVDSVGYGSATNAFVEGAVAAKPADGSAIARKPNGVDTGDNSADFVEQAPTPRAAN